MKFRSLALSLRVFRIRRPQYTSEAKVSHFNNNKYFNHFIKLLYHKIKK